MGSTTGMLTVRNADPGDVAGIAEIYVETWRDAYAGILPDSVLLGLSTQRQAVQWRRTLDHDRTKVAVDGRHGLVGFGSAGPVRGGELPYDGEVYTLYVHPDFQGKGIGRKLLTALFGALLLEGSESAILWVLADNPARFFYEAMGGKWAAVREEKLWGVTLPERGYTWTDLSKAIARSEG